MSTHGETPHDSSTPADFPAWVVRPASHEHCMVCGEHRSCGLRFRAVTANRVETTFASGTNWQGYAGLMHGGMISTLLDAAMTHCLFNIGVEALTASLDVRFVEPIDCRAEFLLRAELRSRRRNLFCVYAEIIANNRRVAHATARFLSGSPNVSRNRQSHQMESLRSTQISATPMEKPQ